MCCKKKIWVYLSIFAVAFITLVLYSKNYHWIKREHRQFLQAYFPSHNFSISEDTITKLKNSRTFIIAPYQDHRDGKNIRTIAIVHKDVTQLYCFIHCRPKNYIYIEKAVLDKHVDRFDFPYVTTDILCPEPINCDPKYIALDSSQDAAMDKLSVFTIQNTHQSTSFYVNFTVCISAMFGNYDNVLQFTQTIEMYKLLGAGRVTIYKNNCSLLIERLLQYYIAEGIVEVVPWPIEKYLAPAKAWHHSMDAKDIGYYGQLVTLNDCMYRNMYRSKYVILIDLDEIILPFKHPDWTSMMYSLQKQHPNVGAFLFENHIFPKHVFSPTEGFNTSSWEAVPGVDILKHIHREPDRKDYFNARKMILNPRKVIQISVHSVLKAYKESLQVPLDVALVYHCRGPLQAALPRGSLIEDPTIRKYTSPLIENVNKVLERNMFLNKTAST
ncbi:glycosyltransferase family 92 protein F13G3.3-like isoform X2 [Pleurodeles waltl]|uniref:glycosyltransferase family 92 protein F13G3.3-like isoform X2 n=1 Tax=Pleurodeles waltl TaxID=8319 RepID=UPI00370948BF